MEGGLVYAGPGNIDITFHGKEIAVISAEGPAETIIDCDNEGRGFMFDSYETPASLLQGFTIRNGLGIDDGGAIYCKYSSPTIKCCVISDNSASSLYAHGGGIYCYSSSPVIENCVVKRNSAVFGAGLYSDGESYALGYPTILNCTFTENTASRRGGGIFCNDHSYMTISNSIVWGNTPHEISQGTIDIDITFSDIKGGWAGEGNIKQDPKFVIYRVWEFVLKPGSPCIDSGDPFIEDKLYDWHPRWPDWYPNGARSDMGAYGGPGNIYWIR